MDFDFNELFKEHSGELVMLALTGFILCTLMVVVPQLLRMHVRRMEMAHDERVKSIEKGAPMAPVDDRMRQAGRIALLVPMVVMIAAATVSCFLVMYKSENLFAVSLAIWVVAGIVSLAAVTGGVALMGRLASIQAGEKDLDALDEDEESETSYMN
jgi:hypothetical protein